MNGMSIARSGLEASMLRLTRQRLEHRQCPVDRRRARKRGGPGRLSAGARRAFAERGRRRSGTAGGRSTPPIA